MILAGRVIVIIAISLALDGVSSVFSRFRAAGASKAAPLPRAWSGWKINGAVAQLGERYNGIVEVRGSIPLGSTK